MKNNVLLMLAVLFFILIISGTGMAEEKVIIAGTGDSQELLRALAKAFEQANPGRKVVVPDSIGSSGGIRAVHKGEAGMARTARPMNEKEKKFNLNYKVFAHSPVVFVANANVRNVNNLSMRQIVGIYSGKITSWSELGGEKGPIYIANREEGDSSRSVLEREIPEFKEIKSFAGQTINSTPETVRTIVKNKNTIGYVPLSMVKDKQMKVMKIEGIYPSFKNVQNSSYRLRIPFALVWKGQMNALSKDFADFIFSPEGHKIIEEHGAYPVSQARD